MADLLVLKAGDADSDAAPEFRYLLSLCLLQARQVYERVTLHQEAESTPLPTGPFAAALLMGRANVLFTAASLARMRAALAAGAREARPLRFADFARAPVYTLRGYEEVEAQVLASLPSPPAAATSHLPLSLLDYERFREVVAEVPLERLLRDPASHPRPLPGHATGVATAGLYHEFIDYYGEPRADVVEFVPPGAREVLEIGCGRGVTGRLIQERLGCRVTGVELNPVVAREASRHLHRVVPGDVQTVALEGRYDAILALEVVEHLTEVEQFFSRLKEWLAPGGRAILSIPNVGHYSVVADLLAGRWDYLPIGLLCYTHYRFFTRRTLADWLRRAGVERFELVAQRTELPASFARLTPELAIDRESLATKGFYVLIPG